MMPPSSNSYELAAGACFAVAGAACDLHSRRIPNRLTGAAVLTALAVSAFLGGTHAILDSLAACLLAGTAFAIMFFMGGMGGGDVKLMAAVAAFAGLGRLAELLLSTALAGGLFALAIVTFNRALGDTLHRIFSCAPARRMPDDTSPNRKSRLYLPYGVPIAIGALFTFYNGVLAS
jgi:prepilin peptidase CpaA